MPAPEPNGIREQVLSALPPPTDRPDGSRPVLWAAVSAGRDSMALLHLLGRNRELVNSRGWNIAAVHIDHGLRSEREALADLELVLSACISFGIPLTVYRSPPGDIGRARAELGGIEAAARELRYRIFTDLRRGGDLTLTAHHADDAREQMVMGFFNGQLEAALEGIAPAAPGILRPFLLCEPPQGRADIDRYVGQNRIPYNDDPTNTDTGYRRNFVRAELLPKARAVMGNVDAHLDRLAGRWRELRVHDNPSPVSWESRGAFGSSAISADPLEVASQDAYSRRRDFLRALPGGLAGDRRIPGRFLDGVFDRLCASDAANGDDGGEILESGYGLSFFRWHGRIWCIGSLAPEGKKGYFFPLESREPTVFDVIPGLRLSVGLRSVRPRNPAGLWLADAAGGYSGQKLLNSPEKNGYLIFKREGGPVSVPSWLESRLPVIIREQVPIGVLHPGGAQSSWRVSPIRIRGADLRSEREAEQDRKILEDVEVERY
jgi:tRNA(Ile)-lysidine synthetase-like protein